MASENQSENLSRRHFVGVIGSGLLAAGANAFGAPLAPPDRQPPDLKLPPTVKKKVGYALVGLGQLCLEEVLPAFGLTERCQVTALVSGHPDKAQKLAQHYGVNPKNIYDYQNFDTIRDNPEVDVVYVILPNSMHAEYTIRAARAGKHVLCEKPMAVTSEECRQMIRACADANRKLMIAYRLRYEPFNQTAIELARKNAYGPIRFLDSANGQMTKAPNIRLSRDLGGGPLGDTGIYCINAFRYLTGEEPVEVFGFAHNPSDDERFREVPASVHFTLRFPSDVVAHGSCSFDTPENRRYRLYCQNGSIDLENAFGYHGQHIVIRDDQGKHEPQLEPVNHFAKEMDHMAECVLSDQTPWTPGEEGLRDMLVIEAIYDSIKSGQKVKVKPLDGSPMPTPTT